ncbi:MAG: hypothetical protein IJT12_05490 [Paludibacteraceae bacterium]|nr:hypothetical protein [Paludibacteraceae bacterium]
MNSRSLIIWVLFLLFCYSLKAQNTDMKIRANGSILPQEYLYLVGGDLNITQHGETTRFILTDSTYIDLYYYEPGDSVLLIRSQCAPLCSSFARVYAEDWSLIRNIPTPRTMILPEAYVENGELRWRDNFVEDESSRWQNAK